MVCRRCYVSGRVQGVFFRASAQQQAAKLGLDGHARNLSDGRVEVLACGDSAQLDALCGWLQTGPPQAQVSDVQCKAVFVAAAPGFRID
ncbi:MAG: acylphosphatase [Gammaproteobacteria bacterium]|nr:acylphosphatase [Gammaproteobacteria bacterium]